MFYKQEVSNNFLFIPYFTMQPYKQGMNMITSNNTDDITSATQSKTAAALKADLTLFWKQTKYVYCWRLIHPMTIQSHIVNYNKHLTEWDSRLAH